MSSTRLPPLPLPLSPIVGRQREIADVVAALQSPDVRLLTLTGAPGVGKTRLAAEAASLLEPRFADGASLVELASVASADLLLPALVQALNVPAGEGTPPERLHGYLRGRRILLVLDNFEHLSGAAPVVARMLGAAPGIRVLITSRVPLRISGEHEYPVPPLPLPPLDASATLAEMAANPSVALFHARARAVRPGFHLADSAPAVAQLCHRLDGIPLAIELAAARSKLLTPQALLERLGNRLATLRGGARDRPARQQTLEAAIAWSYDLLGEAEQRLFAELSVFAGSWSAEAAAAVRGGGGGDTLQLLEALLDHSLIQASTEHAAEPRFRMLETLQEYAAARLQEMEEDADDTAGRRHALHFAALAERVSPLLRGPAERMGLTELDAALADLRAALEWSVSAGDVEISLRLAGSLWEYWRIRGYLTEGRSWLERALALAGGSPTARARALCGVGVLARVQGDLASARTALRESEGMARAAGDHATLADVLTNQGIIGVILREFEQAEAWLDEASALWSELGDSWGTVFALNAQAGLASLRWDVDRARALRLRTAELSRAAGDREGEVRALLGLGEIDRHLGRHRDSLPPFEQALSICRELGNSFHSALLLRKLGHSRLHLGDHAGARAALRESVSLYREMDHRAGIAACGVSFACLLAAEGDAEGAARVLAAADAELESRVGTLQPADGEDREQALSRIRAALDPVTLEEARTRGRAAGTDALLDQLGAGGEPEPLASPPSRVPDAAATARSEPDDPSAALTDREIEVLALLAEGLTYAQIGKRLFISPRTVDAHLRAIYAKIGVRSRHQAAAYARRRGMA